MCHVASSTEQAGAASRESVAGGTCPGIWLSGLRSCSRPCLGLSWVAGPCCPAQLPSCFDGLVFHTYPVRGDKGDPVSRITDSSPDPTFGRGAIACTGYDEVERGQRDWRWGSLPDHDYLLA